MKRYHLLVLFFVSWVAVAADVENGLAPAGKAYRLAWHQEVLIPGDGSADHLTWQGTRVMVQVNAAGHMFLLDQGGFRVLEFDENGAFVRQIGKRGTEEADISRPMNFNVLGDGSGILVEYRQGISSFMYYDKDMNFVSRKSFPQAGFVLRSSVFAPDGKLFHGLYNKGWQDKDHMVMDVVLMDQALDAKQTVKRLEMMAWKRDKITDGEWWVDYMASMFGYIPNEQALVAFGADNQVYTALNGTYEITRWTPELTKDLVFTKKFEGVPMSLDDKHRMITPIYQQLLSGLKPETKAVVTAKHVERAMDKVTWPDTMPPLYALIPLSEGRLLAVSRYDAVTHQSEGDIFDKTGTLIGHTELPLVEINLISSYFGYGARMITQGDKAYAVVHQDDHMALVRYRYELVPVD